MRLSFANGEHADFIMEGGAVSLGNAEGNTLVLPARDVAARHARLTLDARGIVLEVLDPAARTHVNARPVREKALLRCGDTVCLGKVVIGLKPDSDDAIDIRVPLERSTQEPPSQPSRVILRGVSGSHFGKTIAVNSRLVIGRDPACDLVIDGTGIAPRHVAIDNVGEAIYLRNIAAPNGSLVNGVQVDSAIVHPGDQVAFERNHFVVEAPGLPLRGEDQMTNVQSPVEAADAGRAQTGKVDSAQAQGAIWWLIGAAALIALGLVLLIHRGI